MFSNEILEMIFERTEKYRIPLAYQTATIHTIEDILEEMGVDVNVSKSNSDNAKL